MIESTKLGEVLISQLFHFLFETIDLIAASVKQYVQLVVVSCDKTDKILALIGGRKLIWLIYYFLYTHEEPRLLH